ncbi:uncharacterized protein LMH87_007720 [Akanthomyces muscarius]|uniref:3'-5' exonuclease domain-containing protein n=1 Tax=Akanthomyces muscarius TaxID=2231603 RepID=A0A9W8QMQ6_AKAMU|nr:uncharacterized protein LMH87_007720 [Akanthomyces muscarius]KAJ4161698.1 hypothetical protein LMH87_007720 [Akanthomyces muscarius]
MRRPQSENAVAVKPLWSHLFAAPNSNKTRLAPSFRAEKVTCPSSSGPACRGRRSSRDRLFIGFRQRLLHATTYVIDIVALGDAAFMTPGCESSWTMQSVLESTAVPKVVFDIRSQSNALFTRFGVRLGNIHEIQLMEVACRPTSRVYVSGLVKCVWTCPGLADADKQHWVSRKAHYRELCNPAYGGDDALLERRPIEPAVVDMCATNIESLPILWDTYKAQNGGLSMKRILTATRERIAASQASDYKTQGKHMTFAPPSLQVRRASFGRYR